MKPMKRTRALCALIAVSLATCGGSPTDTTYSDLTGSWQGDLQGDLLDGRIRLSLTQQADSISGSGEVRRSGKPTLTIEISSGRLKSHGLFDLWMSIDGRTGWGINGEVAPDRDVIRGLLGSNDGWQRLWLYRR